MQPVSSPRTKLSSLISTVLFAGTLLLSFNAHGAENEKTRWYDVEVIIFSQTSQQYRDSEMWPVDYDLQQLEATQELLPATTRGAGQAGDTPVPFTRLDKQSLQLNAQAERIDAAPDTELLLHLGWRQPGLAEDKAVAIRVDESMQEGSQAKALTPPNETASPSSAGNMLMLDAVPPHRMEGTLKLVLSRYLHIYADLLYREPLAEGATLLQPAQTGVDLFNLAEEPFSSSMQPRYQVYHLQQSRRMRSRELHYLDHPIIGMVILVTPYEVKEADTDTAPAE